MPKETGRRQVDAAVASYSASSYSRKMDVMQQVPGALPAAIPSILVAYPSTTGPALLVTEVLGANGLALCFLLTPSAVEIFGLKSSVGSKMNRKLQGKGLPADLRVCLSTSMTLPASY